MPLRTPIDGVLICPSDVLAFSLDGRSVAVSFPMPKLTADSIDKGECAPSSGSRFRVGATTVACRATEAAAVVAGCTFAVMVEIPPLTSELTYLAFGDSITEGVVPDALAFARGPRLLGPSVHALRRPAGRVNPSLAYPARLNALLKAQYPRQDPVVINRGVSGELADEGSARLVSELDAYKPDVVILLEGVNDILFQIVDSPGSTVRVGSIANRLLDMVDLALSRDVEVLLATLTPVTDDRESQWPGLQAGIDALNGEIRQIATQRRIGPAVNVFSALSADLSLIGADGLHPTGAGYARLAEVFLAAVRARFESTPSPVPVASVPLPRSLQPNL